MANELAFGEGHLTSGTAWIICGWVRDMEKYSTIVRMRRAGRRWLDARNLPVMVPRITIVVREWECWSSGGTGLPQALCTYELNELTRLLALHRRRSRHTSSNPSPRRTSRSSLRSSSRSFFSSGCRRSLVVLQASLPASIRFARALHGCSQSSTRSSVRTFGNSTRARSTSLSISARRRLVLSEEHSPR